MRQQNITQEMKWIIYHHESKKSPPLRPGFFWHLSHFFPIYARLQIFIQLSVISNKIMPY